ncbi:MAG: CAP domain-containing protein [Acidobacteria bacterium]|nr:CAP domain-containing protein [Acidobacteriota bacterium]
MKRKVARVLPLSVAVCLLALAAPAAATAQNKTRPNPRTAPKGKAAPVAKTTPKTEAGPAAVVASPAAKTESAAGVGFLSKLEQEVIDEMNLARTEPQKYAAFVEEYKKNYDGNRLTLPGRKKAIVTNDGIAAVDEAINFLRAQTPLPPLTIARGVCLAAKDHAVDLSTKGVQGHRGSDGSTPNARVDRYGRWDIAIGETIVYEVGAAREMVIALIIDDGVPNRGHRRNIFDSNHRVTGVSVSEPATYGSKCVIDYVGGFKEQAAGADQKR